MYESGLSKTARLLLVVLATLLGLLFIMSSGCSCANAQQVVIKTAAGEQHSFF